MTSPAVPSRKPRPLVPKDAASVVLIDRSGAAPRLLMGRRRADLAFLAGKYVFPGGRVDKADKTGAAAVELPEATLAQLMLGMRGRPTPARARALGVAAARELYEEAGFTVGAPGEAEGPAAADLSKLIYFARAITPPGRARRYDTRFFMASAGHASQGRYHGDGELQDLAWLTFEEIDRLDLTGITRMILSDISGHLSDPPPGTRVPIPFYYQRSGAFRRDVL